MLVAEAETDEIPTTMVWIRHFSVIEESFSNGRPVKTVDIDIFTDGAFTDTSAGGAGVAVNREGLIIEEEALYLGQNSSAYQAEVMAIKSAAELIQLRWPEYRVITLYSDYQAALQAVGQNFVKSQLVLDTVAALNQASRSKATVESLATNGLTCWPGKGPTIPFGKQHNSQNYHLVSLSCYIVWDLRAGGMNIGNLALTAARRSNGFPLFAKRFPSNFYRRGGKSLVKWYSC